MPCMSLRIPISLPFFPFFQVYFLGFFFLAAPVELNSEFCWEVLKSLQDLLPGGGFIPNFFVVFWSISKRILLFFAPIFPSGATSKKCLSPCSSPPWNSWDFPSLGMRILLQIWDFLGILLLPPLQDPRGSQDWTSPRHFWGFCHPKKSWKIPFECSATLAKMGISPMECEQGGSEGVFSVFKGVFFEWFWFFFFLIACQWSAWLGWGWRESKIPLWIQNVGFGQGEAPGATSNPGWGKPEGIF